MRPLPLAALLLLAACANGGNAGKDAGAPGVDIAEAAARGGSPQVAVRIDDAILAKDPHNVAALINRGDLQTALQQPDAAAQSYADALQADPKSVRARIGLGRLRLGDDPSAAEALFLEALQREPHNAAALNDLGIARDLLGRHQDAQAAYRQAIGLNPSMTGAQVNLALSLAMSGRADDATPLLRPLASAPNASRKLRHDLAAVLAMGGDRSGAEHILAQDLPPEQVTQALSIFAAANPPSGAAHMAGTPRSTTVALAEVTSDGGPAAAGSASVIPLSAALATIAPPTVAPPTVAPPAVVPVRVAPLNVAPPSVAPPIVAPLIVAPPSVVPPSVGPAGGAPATVAATGASPTSAGPANAGPAGGSLVSNGVPSAGSPSDGVLVQLSSAPSNEAAAAEWRRLQKRWPDLLADRQPVMFQSQNAGGMPWGIRTAGFVTLKDAKGFCQTVTAYGLSCYVVGSEVSPPSNPAHPSDVPASSPVASTAAGSGGAPGSGARASDAPASGTPPSAGSASTAASNGGPLVQLSSAPTSDSAAAEWRRIQKRMPDLLADRQPVIFQSDSTGGMSWGVRTGGFADLGAAKGFCQTVSARGLTCYVIGS